MNDTPLIFRARINAVYRFREPGQAILTGYQDLIHSTVLLIASLRQPEVGAFSF